ncbi:response regulator transcription factor [Nocardioides sp. LMS-CY]|uniref:response regulator n=1 Tax=Nocardioides sp. (strain LMS-CY) TaxID=2840457 RepID=UPI001C005488|nr:response regulator transcription factor [Nocardioides sp. LMS-CY]QWF20981.1 response regulator transcription factor [Nocardioides sp. LMS-CY]
MIKVVIADDQDLVRGGLSALLACEPDITVVGEATDGQQAVGLARERAADVVLLDIEMPGSDGLQGIRALAQARPEARALMLTTFDLDEYVFEALRAGASGFLLKTTPPAELSAGIRAVHAGEMLFARSVVRRLVETFVRQPPTPTASGVLSSLTEREVEVLRAIARGLSNAEIGAELYLAETTVKTHVARILAKLNLRDRVQAVVVAYETGLVRPGA